MRPPKTPLDPKLPMWIQDMQPGERPYREAQMRLGQIWRWHERDETYIWARNMNLRQAEIDREDWIEEDERRHEMLMFDYATEESTR
jgi:hypothetical protein